MVRVARKPASLQAKYVAASMATNPGNYNYDLSVETQALLASIINPRGNIIVKPIVKLIRLDPGTVNKGVHSFNGILNGNVKSQPRVSKRSAKNKVDLKSEEIVDEETEVDNKAKRSSANTKKLQKPNKQNVPRRIIRNRRCGRRAPIVQGGRKSPTVRIKPGRGGRKSPTVRPKAGRSGRKAPAVRLKTGLVQRVKPYLLKNKICKLNQKLETFRSKRLSGEGELEPQVNSEGKGELEERESNPSVSEDTQGAQDTQSAQDTQDTAEVQDIQNSKDSQDALDYECVRQGKPLVVKIRRKSEDIRAKRRASRSQSIVNKEGRSASPPDTQEPRLAQSEGAVSPDEKNTPDTVVGRRRTITNETRKKSIALLKANRQQSQSPNEDRLLASNATNLHNPKAKSPKSKTASKNRANPMNGVPEQSQNAIGEDDTVSQETGKYYSFVLELHWLPVQNRI